MSPVKTLLTSKLCFEGVGRGLTEEMSRVGKVEGDQETPGRVWKWGCYGGLGSTRPNVAEEGGERSRGVKRT